MTGPATGAERFSASAQQVVDYLNVHTELGDWSVSRITGGEQVHLHVHHESLVEVGARVDLPETFCSRMLAGADRYVSDSLQHPVYKELKLAPHIRAYAGVPIRNDDGSLFGVLCGLGDQPAPEMKGVEPDLLDLLASLLSKQLAASRALDHDRRQLEIAEALTHRDELTGLLNRRGWDALVADAQQRIDAFGDLVGIAVLDLDGLKEVNDRHGHQAGDELLRAAGAVLRDNARTDDRMARYGGDEFAVLLDGVPAADLERYCDRLQQALQQAGVAASIGSVTVGPGASLVDSFAVADRQMYSMKRRRRLQLA